MKTPEEIKKWLEICIADKSCRDYCPFNNGNCDMQLERDALIYIQQLEQRLVEVNKTSPRWISVKDRLPERDGLYYCHTAICGDIMCRYANGIWFDNRARFTNHPRRPTFWLEILEIPEIPELPKEGKENVT